MGGDPANRIDVVFVDDNLEKARTLANDLLAELGAYRVWFNIHFFNPGTDNVSPYLVFPFTLDMICWDTHPNHLWQFLGPRFGLALEGDAAVLGPGEVYGGSNNTTQQDPARVKWIEWVERYWNGGIGDPIGLFQSPVIWWWHRPQQQCRFSHGIGGDGLGFRLCRVCREQVIQGIFDRVDAYALNPGTPRVYDRVRPEDIITIAPFREEAQLGAPGLDIDEDGTPDIGFALNWYLNGVSCGEGTSITIRGTDLRPGENLLEFRGEHYDNESVIRQKERSAGSHAWILSREAEASLFVSRSEAVEPPPFSPPVSWSWATQTFLVDLDGDAIPEIGEIYSGVVRFYRRDPEEGTFRRVDSHTVSIDAVPAVSVESGRIVACDVDGDGREDLILPVKENPSDSWNSPEGVRLLLNREDGFEVRALAVTSPGRPAANWSLFAWDADGDGDVDIGAIASCPSTDLASAGALTRGASASYFRNQGNGDFVEMSAESGFAAILSPDPSTDLVKAVHIVPVRLAGETRSSLFAIREISNRLDEHRFEAMTGRLGASGRFGWVSGGIVDAAFNRRFMQVNPVLPFHEHVFPLSLCAEDVDADGREDVVAAPVIDGRSVGATFSTKTYLFSGNDQGALVESFIPPSLARACLASEAVWYRSTPRIFDMDLDGTSDLLLAAYDHSTYAGRDISSHLYRSGGGAFTDVKQAILASAALRRLWRTHVADMDGDGLPDLVGVDPFSPRVVLSSLRQSGVSDRHWLGVEVRNRSGSYAIGASVKVTAGDLVQERTVYAADDDKKRVFGLGTRVATVEVDVTWPDGKTAHLAGVPIDRTIVVPEPGTVAAGMEEPQ